MPTAATGLLIRERQPLGPSEVLYRRAGSAGSRLAPEDVTAAAAAGLFADRSLAAHHGHHPGTLGECGGRR